MGEEQSSSPKQKVEIDLQSSEQASKAQKDPKGEPKAQQ